MKMYVANATKQINQFWYKTLGRTTPIRQDIREGGQIQIAGDLLPEDIDYIVGQHSQYGLVKVDEIDRTKTFTGLCYSLNTPIKMEKIQKLMMHNQEVLVERAETTLRDTAIANGGLVEDKVTMLARDNRMPAPRVGDFEATIVEESTSGVPSKTNFFRNGTETAAGIRVSRTEAAPQGRGRRASK